MSDVGPNTTPPGSLLEARDNAGAMLDPEFLRLCTNPACERVVPASFQGARQVEYCCPACAQAHGTYEIHPDGPLAHSPGCDQRWSERRGREVRFGR